MQEIASVNTIFVESMIEMIALFVEPDFIGKGVGSKLWKHSLEIAKDLGWNKFMYNVQRNNFLVLEKTKAHDIEQRLCFRNGAQ